MKIFPLFFLCTILPIYSLKAQRDTLFLTNGNVIPCTIGRVGSNTIRFLERGAAAYEKIDADKVNDIIIGDDFFTMTEDRRFVASTVIGIEGFSKEEIFEAAVDWVQVNQRTFRWNGIHYANEQHFILQGSMNTREFTNLDLPTITSLVSGEILTYYIAYDIKLRAKDNKMKVYIDNLEIVSTLDYVSNRDFSELFRRRLTASGKPTNNMLVIQKVKDILAHQLEEIKQHVAFVRLNGTWERNLIESLLRDDDW